MYLLVIISLPRRAALEKWKQKLGSNATYNNLIGAFERAGYRGYADTVRKICGGSPLTIISKLSMMD